MNHSVQLKENYPIVAQATEYRFDMLLARLAPYNPMLHVVLPSARKHELVLASAS